MRMMDRRERRLLTLLEKLVRPGRSLKLLYREWSRRQRQRRSLMTTEYLEVVARRRRENQESKTCGGCRTVDSPSSTAGETGLRIEK
jgi:hypothetical protein